MILPNIILPKTFNQNKVSWLALCIVVYRAIMDLIYCLWISPYYSYWNMQCELDPIKIILVYVLFVSMIPFILRHCMPQKASDYIMLIWDFMYFIPGTTYITYQPCSLEYILLFYLFYSGLVVVNEVIDVKIARWIRIDRHIAAMIICMLVVVTMGFVINYNGISVKLDFSDIYFTRELYRNVSKQYNKIFKYLKNPMAKVIPICVYYCLRRKRYLISAVLVFLQLSLYSMGANKIDMILLIISIAAAFINLNERWLVGGFALLSIVALILCIIFKSPVNGITDKLVRRMMFTPNHISTYYYDYFKYNEPLWFSTTVFKKVSPMRFDKDISYVIGDYMGLPGNNANNGLFGMAYADCKALAIILYPVLYGVLFATFNFCSKNIEKGVVILTAVTIAVIYLDANFFTALLSHGVVLLLVGLILIGSIDNNASAH